MMASSWPEAVLAVLANGEVDPIARVWIDLARIAGPTPARGPLRHDFLLPGGQGQLGLNVFCHDERLVDPFARAVERTAAALGGEAARAARDLLATGARWSGGFALLHGEPRLKLYASEGFAAAAASLGLAGRAIAIGVDVTHRGWERARSYRLAAADPSWAPSSAWLALPVEGVSHRLLATLDGPDRKRSFDLIFGPEASLDALHAAGARIASLDPTLPASLEPGLLGRLSGVAERFGLVLRPVAHEVDVFSDGRRATDVLVTLASS